MTATLDIAEVRRALDTKTVLEFYGWATKRSGRDLESKACPQRNDHSRRALVITPANGLWKCHACDAGGDLFDFVAEVEKLDIHSDFPAVLKKAAEIARVTPSDVPDEERARRREEWRKQRAADEAKERAERAELEAAAIPKATSAWAELHAADDRGAAYLADRGVAAAMRFQIVRFDDQGNPALALYTSSGEIRNVVRRRLPELGEPKTPGLYRCPSAGTLVNTIRDIELGGDRDVVVTEGVFDSITAAVMWPGAIILGAHGAGNLHKVVRMAAPAVAKARTRLFLVPHHDLKGAQAAKRAGEIALAAGLLPLKTLHVIKHGSKDLNDAYRGGWRAA